MALPHNWDECRPAILAAADVSSDEQAKFQAAFDQLWPTLTGMQRVLFHEFTCLNMTDAEHSANVAKITKMAEALIK